MKMLIIEDQRTVRIVLEDCLQVMFGEVEGFELRTAVNLGEGRRIWAEMRPHTVLLDLNLGDSDGMDTIEAIPDFAKVSDVVVVSGEKSLRPLCHAAGCMDFLNKQWILTRVDEGRGPRFKFMDLLDRLSSSYYRCINGPQRT